MSDTLEMIEELKNFDTPSITNVAEVRAIMGGHAYADNEKDK
jgi:hypothetical protein